MHKNLVESQRSRVLKPAYETFKLNSLPLASRIASFKQIDVQIHNHITKSDSLNASVFVSLVELVANA